MWRRWLMKARSQQYWVSKLKLSKTKGQLKLKNWNRCIVIRVSNLLSTCQLKITIWKIILKIITRHAKLWINCSSKSRECTFIALLVCREHRPLLQLTYLCTRNQSSGSTHPKLKKTCANAAMVASQTINVYRERFKNTSIFSTNRQKWKKW